jgi:hypothetical protein
MRKEVIIRKVTIVVYLCMLTLLVTGCPPAIPSMISWAGFRWDSEQKIFYSKLDPWQAKFGYFELYDTMAPYSAMNIHCEPVLFSYGGKSWKIEFWKGQYGLCTGGEIGIYTGEFDIDTGITWIDRTVNAFDFGSDTRCASGDDMLKMSFVLKRKNDGEALFTRDSDKHWWLTGFKPFIFMIPLPPEFETLIVDPEELDNLIAILKTIVSDPSRLEDIKTLLQKYIPDPADVEKITTVLKNLISNPLKLEEFISQLEEFKLISRPSLLIMDIIVVSKDAVMRNAFVTALHNMGYSNIVTNGNSVNVSFDMPFTEQPPSPWLR